MSDGMKKIGDARLAQRFMGTLFEEIDLPRGARYYDTCISLDIGDKACRELTRVLTNGDRNYIYNVAGLQVAGFSDEFIDELVGQDGGRFTRMRLKNLGERVVTRLWRPIMEEIVRYRSESAYAVPYLIEATSDDDRDIKKEAIVTLRELGPFAHEAVPRLIELLKDNDKDISWNAIFAIGVIHAYPEKSIPLLLKYSRQVREAGNDYRGYIGFIQLFGKAGVSYLLDEIKRYVREDEAYASDLIYALGGIGDDAKEAWPHLVKIEESAAGSIEIQTAIAFALVDIGAPPEIAIPRFTEAIKKMLYLDSDSLYSRLVKLSYIPDDLFERVSFTLKTSLMPAEDLIAILKKANPALAKPVLIEKLAHRPEVKTYAKALSETRLEVADIEKIVETAVSSFKSIADSTLETALQNISDEGIDRLLAISRSGNRRDCATRLLGLVGGKRQDVIDHLLDLLDDRSISHRATGALETIGAKAIPSLIARLNDKRVWYRQTVIMILAHIKKRPELVIPVLIKAATQDVTIVREISTWALGEFAGEYPESVLPAVPVLIMNAKDTNLKVRCMAVHSLRALGDRLGSGLREALPVLEMIRADESDPSCKQYVEEAIENILDDSL